MKEIFEFLEENADFGVRVAIGDNEPVYMSSDEAMRYLYGKDVELDFIECDNSAVVLLVNNFVVSMEAN